MTLNGSWGWMPLPPRSLREILQLLLENATGNGNFLLNVGPKADGQIEPIQAERLREVGAWLTNMQMLYTVPGVGLSATAIGAA